MPGSLQHRSASYFPLQRQQPLLRWLFQYCAMSLEHVVQVFIDCAHALHGKATEAYVAHKLN
jgi:hypothetical protein